MLVVSSQLNSNSNSNSDSDSNSNSNSNSDSNSNSNDNGKSKGKSNAGILRGAQNDKRAMTSEQEGLVDSRFGERRHVRPR